MIGNLDIRSRPIRLGFLVNPNRVNSVKQAIEICSSLWGGAHYPIIPVFNKRTPKNWDGLHKTLSAEKVVKGYIEAFDPDLLVQCIPDLPQYIKNLGLEVIKPSEIWQPLVGEKESGPNFGIGVFELYNEIFEEHFKYKEKYPLHITIPKIPQRYSLFWSSVFGSLPTIVSKSITIQLKKALEITTPKIEISKIKSLLDNKVVFPRRVTQYGLKYQSRSGFRRDSSVFFMDATKILDVIDYWNLRALGKQVIPLPIQYSDEQALKQLVSDFIVLSYRPYKRNPQMFNEASLIRSRNTKMEDMQEYVKGLDIKRDPTNPSKGPQFSLQHWYPRIWDDWARDKDGAEADDIYHDEERIDINESDSKLTIQIKPLQPKFIFEFVGHGTPRIANEISCSLYGTIDAFAQVFPKGHGNHLLRTIGDITSMKDEWRVGRNGLVKLVKDNFTDRWNVPKAEDILFAWLRDNSWNPKLSTPGLMAKQINNQMEGFVRTFANEKLLKLLEHMNGGNEKEKEIPTINERELPVAEVKSKLRQDTHNNNDKLHEYLISKNVFRVGSKIQCPNCRRNSFYGLDSIKETINCPRCLNNFPALGNLEESTWHYKTAGPFSIPGYADGAYCVLLSLEFLEREMHGLKITPTYSFTADNQSGKKLEADFALLWQQKSYKGVQEGILFGECKTFGTFKEKDFQRMGAVAEEFPGAVLAFCTLRTSLTPVEKKALIKIAKAGRKLFTSERCVNPVLILTGNEIFSDFGPPYCWKNTPNEKKFEHLFGILEMANASQQIYLGLPSWEDKWFKNFKRKIKLQGKTTVVSKK